MENTQRMANLVRGYAELEWDKVRWGKIGGKITDDLASFSNGNPLLFLLHISSHTTPTTFIVTDKVEVVLKMGNYVSLKWLIEYCLLDYRERWKCFINKIILDRFNVRNSYNLFSPWSKVDACFSVPEIDCFTNYSTFCRALMKETR